MSNFTEYKSKMAHHIQAMVDRKYEPIVNSCNRFLSRFWNEDEKRCCYLKHMLSHSLVYLGCRFFVGLRFVH